MRLIKPAAVSPGEVISASRGSATSASPGDATGCHLHFKYWRGISYSEGRPVDPALLKVLDHQVILSASAVSAPAEGVSAA